jgi:hypothetical protein
VVYAQAEEVNLPGFLVIVNRGLVVRGGAVKGRNKCFGEDFMLGEKLRTILPTLSLTFVELLLLDQAQFHAVMSIAPIEDYHSVRTAVLRFTLIRGIKYAAREELLRRGGNGSLVNSRKKTFFSKYDSIDVSAEERDNILAVGDDLAEEHEGKEMAELKSEMKDLRELVESIAQHLKVAPPVVKEPLSPLAALPRVAADTRRGSGSSSQGSPLQGPSGQRFVGVVGSLGEAKAASETQAAIPGDQGTEP